MHTYHKDGFSAAYNSDFSGSIILLDENSNASLTVPSLFIFELVANAVRNQRIREAEQATTEQLLGFAPKESRDDDVRTQPQAAGQSLRSEAISL